MSKHTPGPWYIGKDTGDQNRHIYAEQMVCSDDGEEWHPLIACTDDDEQLIDWQANARLIAAAPDLLAALQQCVEHGIFPSAVEHVRAAARAVIAKATGDRE